MPRVFLSSAFNSIHFREWAAVVAVIDLGKLMPVGILVPQTIILKLRKAVAPGCRVCVVLLSGNNDSIGPFG